MNKKIIIISGILLILLIILYKGLTNPQKQAPVKNVSTSSSNDKFSLIQGALSPNQDYKSALNSFDSINYDEFMDGIRSGKRNFVWEIWALRKNCSKNSSLEDCNQNILEMIEKNNNYSSEAKEELKRIFTSYFRYENEIRNYGNLKSKKNFSKKYNALKMKRREFFTEDDARLVFGMEESQVDFIDASANFIKKNKKLTGTEKVLKYDTLKKEKYGAYYDAQIKREDRYQNYQTELDLMQSDLKNLPENGKAQKIRSILEKHFGKKEAERIFREAKKEEEIRLKNKKL
jgi:hypothetical protein